MVSSKWIFGVLSAYASLISVSAWNHASIREFQAIVNENERVLVAFVAPWTEACTALEKEWSSARGKVQIPLISIDCTAESALCDEKSVISYPAIRLYKGVDVMTRYRGAREASAIVSFMNIATLPVVSFLDKKNITDFKSASEAVFIAYLSPEDASLQSAFTELAARNHHRFAFGIVTSSSLAKADGIPIPSIVCYKVSDGEQGTLSGQSGISEMEEFMERLTKPPIEEMTRRNELRYLNSGKSLLYIFIRTAKDRKQYSSALRPLARKYAEYISFVTIDALEYGHMMPALGLQEGILPALALQNPMFGQIFPFDQRRTITAEAVEGWIGDIAAGRILPLGSEEESRGRDEL